MRKLIIASAAASFVLAAGVVTTVFAKAEDKTVEGELVDMSCYSKNAVSRRPYCSSRGPARAHRSRVAAHRVMGCRPSG